MLTALLGIAGLGCFFLVLGGIGALLDPDDGWLTNSKHRAVRWLGTLLTVAFFAAILGFFLLVDDGGGPFTAPPNHGALHVTH